MTLIARDELLDKHNLTDINAPAGEHRANDINTKIWRLFDSYTLPQAAALIVDIDPSAIAYSEQSRALIMADDAFKDIRVKHANTIFALLKEKNPNETNIKKENLIDFLVEKNCNPAFFNPEISYRIVMKKLEELDKLELAFSKIREENDERIITLKELAEESKATKNKTEDIIKSNLEVRNRLLEDSQEMQMRLQEISARVEKTITAYEQKIKSSTAYLDPENPRYAPKLAAAIRAWESIGDPQGKTPKKAMEAWLTSNAQELDLLNTDGTVNQTAIEEIAKVANWKPGGGVPATPGK